MGDNIYKLVKEEYDTLGVIPIPNMTERLCSSVGAHILNLVNLEQQHFHDAGSPQNFRVHVCFMIPSGWGKSAGMGLFADPRYGFLSKSPIPTTMATTFTNESWIGTANRNSDTNEWEITSGVLATYKHGIVAADEYAKFKSMVESHGEEHDVSYLLSALDKDYCEKQHSGAPIRIEDIGMTFWCGLRPVRMQVANSGLARRFSFQTYYPTFEDAREFKHAVRYNKKKPISGAVLDSIADCVVDLEESLQEVKDIDLTDVYRYLDATGSTSPHFEESIYSRIAIGFSVATGRFPNIKMCKELRLLLDDERQARRQIKVNPEVEMVYSIIRHEGKVGRDLVEEFMHNNYQLGYGKVIGLIQSLKQSGRIVEFDGYLVDRQSMPSSRPFKVVSA